MEKDIRHTIITVVLTIIILLELGTLGYMIVEGWSFLDGLYMTVITLATIGYGEVHPLSNTGRIYTIFLIFGGIGLVTYAFSTITALVIGGHLTDAFRRRKMDKTIESLKNHYIVCGASHTGYSIMTELKKTGRQFVLIDNEPCECNKLMDMNCLIVQGDATSDKTLEKAGVRNAKGLFCTLTNDKDNAFIALAAKGLNPALRIITTQKDEDVKDKLLRSGSDVVINPNWIGGLRMVSEMVRPATVGFLDWMLRESSKGLRFEDIKIPDDSPVTGKGIGSLKGADGNSALVVAIKLPGILDYEINPTADRKLVNGEVLVAMGTQEQIKDLKNKIKA